jgi:hypothetical protein
MILPNNPYFDFLHHYLIAFFLIAISITGCKDGPFSSSSDLVNVSGKVLYQYESGDLIPVSNARIGTINHRTSAYSNSAGEFVLRDIKPGIVTFVVSHEDYLELEVPMEIKKSGNDSVVLVFPADLLGRSIHGVVYDAMYPPRHSEAYPHDLDYTGVPGVSVIINGEEKAFTDYRGRYTIDKLKGTVVDITFSKPKWETITVEVDPRRKSYSHNPYPQPLTPITEQYYAMSVGNYWEYSYRYTESGNDFMHHAGRITWRVTGEHVDEDGKWYELEEHALYDIFMYPDRTYLRTHNEINNLKVRDIGFSWVFFNENSYEKYRLIKDVKIGVPDRIEETITGPYHPVGGYSKDHFVYERNVGLVAWEYNFSFYNKEWKLIEFQTK